MEDLSCVRGGRLVFRGLSLHANAGTVLSIEGANGAGKTSLLRMLAGFLAPASGTIRFGATDSEERGKFIGWLGHHDGAKPQLTPAETLRFFANLHGVRVDTDDALQSVGLSRARDLPCQYLSAGQKKRLALARLKTSGRPLWLLDEPLAALDASGKALLRDMIAAHCATGGIAIAATHEPLGLDGTRLVLGAA
ncbi:MAG TPA: heme ABC exporter ATP-binding protein CcmA [Rhizomicrobium sp.]|nr:heme ABC exporter ATP-binding protein CcmA [Rhizomicrobium sp.]